jgi:glyoxylase-like metal-dependent hydrolase (beta-lactamase superfamily II)
MRSENIRVPSRRKLTWEVFLAPSIPAIAPDVPPGETARPWPPISSTLISGERDAVLVDTPITVEQSRALVNWVVARGKNLTTIYATHGHGDHFFGTSTVLERFPGARFVARPEVIKIMRQQASPESLETFWNPRFPDQISSQLAIAEELTGNVIGLEGHDLVSVPLGFTDTASTTCLHVPSIGLIVAGDAAYNGDHLHLSESPGCPCVLMTCVTVSPWSLARWTNASGEYDGSISTPCPVSGRRGGSRNSGRRRHGSVRR